MANKIGAKGSKLERYVQHKPLKSFVSSYVSLIKLIVQ